MLAQFPIPGIRNHGSQFLLVRIRATSSLSLRMSVCLIAADDDFGEGRKLAPTFRSLPLSLFAKSPADSERECRGARVCGILLTLRAPVTVIKDNEVMCIGIS